MRLERCQRRHERCIGRFLGVWTRTRLTLIIDIRSRVFCFFLLRGPIGEETQSSPPTARQQQPKSVSYPSGICHAPRLIPGRCEAFMQDELFQEMKQAIIDGDPDHARELSLKAIAQGIPPLDAIHHGFVPGLNVVGQQFEAGEMFLPDLVLAGEAMKAATSALEPEIQKAGATRESLGKIVLGTVKGDIHEIGKTLVGTMLSANGFEVFDLGVDVPFESFALKAKELNADLIGVSALLTTTMTGQKDVVEALARHGLRPRVKIIVGGAPVTQSWADEIGADGYGKDAFASLALAKSLLKKQGKLPVS